MPFFKLSEMEFQQKRGFLFKGIRGQHMEMYYITLKPDQTTGHSHPEEQMGYIFSGEVELTIGDETRVCSAGDAYWIPPHVPHGFKVISNDDLTYIEIFSPPKPENLI